MLFSYIVVLRGDFSRMSFGSFCMVSIIVTIRGSTCLCAILMGMVGLILLFLCCVLKTRAMIWL